MKTKTTLILILFINFCFSQEANEKKFLNNLKDEMCKCYSLSETKVTGDLMTKNETLLNKYIPSCIQNYLLANEKEYTKIVLNKGYDKSMTDVQMGRKYYNENIDALIFDKMIDECKIFRESLIGLKTGILEKIVEKGKEADIEKNINLLEGMSQKIHKSKKEQYYMFLGLLYEMNKNDSKALEYYNKTIENNPNSTKGKVFKKLLLKYK